MSKFHSYCWRINLFFFPFFVVCVVAETRRYDGGGHARARGHVFAFADGVEVITLFFVGYSEPERS